METLTIQKIENDNFLLNRYLKRAISWDQTKEFAPDGINAGDLTDLMAAYGLYDEDRFIGLSLVTFDSNGNITSLKSVVNNIGDVTERTEYLEHYISNIETKTGSQSNGYVKKMKRY